MPSIDVKKRRIDSKIVFYGPGRSGKTQCLKFIHDSLEEGDRGRFSSLPTKADPSLYIDVLPMRFGKIIGFDTVFHLCSGPGQALAMNTRKLLLRDADGIVFVADCQRSRRDANIDSFNELHENLRTYRLQLRNVPHVLLYNKCDLAERLSVEELREDVNRYTVPDFETSAITGRGILDALQAVVTNVGRDLQSRI